MEYGYENASMRRVGQRCDMTAAGLYRHCKDKAGLFGELVSPSIERKAPQRSNDARRRSCSSRRRRNKAQWLREQKNSVQESC